MHYNLATFDSSVSYETSSKSEAPSPPKSKAPSLQKQRNKRFVHKSKAPSLQNERFVRDFRHTVCHRLEANISHDTTNHPAHQRHAASTPACFVVSRTTFWPLLSPAFRMRPRPKVMRQVSKPPFSTRLPPKVKRQVSKTSVSSRLPPKVKRQVSKTSVSYETSSKSDAPSLQNSRAAVALQTGHF